MYVTIIYFIVILYKGYTFSMTIYVYEYIHTDIIINLNLI